MGSSVDRPGGVRPARWLVTSVWALAGLAASLLIVRGYTLFQNPYSAFPTYYTAAKLLQNGEDFSRFYDDAWFFQRAGEIARPELYNANTPLMAFFFLPLT